MFIWFIVTLLFAGVYNLAWLRRPDYFRLQSDLNIRPIDLATGVHNYDIFGDRPLPAIPSRDLQAAASRLRTAYEDAQVASGILAASQRALRAQERITRAGNGAFEASQWAQMEAYVRARTAPFGGRILELQRTMAAMLHGTGARSAEQIPAGPVAVAYAELRVRVAEQRLGQANAEAIARDYVIRHLEEFQHTPEQQGHLRQIRLLEALQQSTFEKQSRARALAGRVLEAEDEYRRAAASRLGFGDFIYFSIGGATGANFGDISPNHTNVRLLYSLQICVSIGLLALALEALVRE